MKANRFLFFALACASATLPLARAATSSAAQAQARRSAEEFLRQRSSPAAAADSDAATVRKILARPDPGTFFLRYAFAIQRNAKKLLTEAQAKELAAVMERHTPVHSRWHDERNTVRCKWNELMWRYVAASSAEAPALRRELEEWMRLRMAWTLQEHLAQYRFARDVWGVLAMEQQARLLAGGWKDFVKLDTGHTRADATAKIIIRALGKPERLSDFEMAGSAWSKDRTPLHAAVNDAGNNERRIVFAMDLNDEALAMNAARTANDAFAKLSMAEADATRRLVQAGYAGPEARCAKAAADAWAEAPKRFSAGAAELIRLLQRP
jgi:hypothetical protein